MDGQDDLNAILARGTQVYVETAEGRVAELRRFIATTALTGNRI
jgi:hypothetical protein